MAIIVIDMARNNTGHQPATGIKACLVSISIEVLRFFVPFAIITYHYPVPFRSPRGIFIPGVLTFPLPLLIHPQIGISHQMNTIHCLKLA